MFSYHSFLLLCPFWKSPFFCLFPISSPVLIILIHAFYLDIPLSRRYPFIFGILYSLFVLPLFSNPIVLLYHLITPLSSLLSLFSLRLFLSLSFIPIICTSLCYRTYPIIPLLEQSFPFCNFRSFIIVSLQSSLSFPYVE